jgi:hypothetical protein
MKYVIYTCKQGMQCSVKCIYTVHCTALHHNKNRKIHIPLCSVKKILRCFFLHSAVFYVYNKMPVHLVLNTTLHILMCTVRKKKCTLHRRFFFTQSLHFSVLCNVHWNVRTENTALHTLHATVFTLFDNINF